MVEDQPYDVEARRNAYAAKEERAKTIGSLGGMLAFAVTWIYCMSEYGFLFGFGFGWMPSLIIGFLVGFSLFGMWKP